ncbi:MAG: hypothetical protein HKN36_02445 [Hellea sp.]|nr:hypothetical protein [Hellea sp.]
MIKRVPSKNEVDDLQSTDGKTIFSIRKRHDGNYEFFLEVLNFDSEEDAYYWTQNILPHPSIFGSISDAKAEIFAQFGHMLNAN